MRREDVLTYVIANPGCTSGQVATIEPGSSSATAHLHDLHVAGKVVRVGSRPFRYHAVKDLPTSQPLPLEAHNPLAAMRAERATCQREAERLYTEADRMSAEVDKARGQAHMLMQRAAAIEAYVATFAGGAG